MPTGGGPEPGCERCRNFAPISPADVTDASLVAGQLRALQAKVDAGFELLANRLDTIMGRFAERQDDHAQRIDQLERDQSRTDERLAALEAWAIHQRDRKHRP